jgi:hypothetical protein
MRKEGAKGTEFTGARQDYVPGSSAPYVGQNAGFVDTQKSAARSVFLQCLKLWSIIAAELRESDMLHTREADALVSALCEYRALSDE